MTRTDSPNYRGSRARAAVDAKLYRHPAPDQALNRDQSWRKAFPQVEYWMPRCGCGGVRYLTRGTVTRCLRCAATLVPGSVPGTRDDYVLHCDQ